MQDKRLYGLIGYPLGHSFSERYFTDKFNRENVTDAEYRNFPLPSAAEIPGFLSSHPQLCGFNVTIPYKREIMRWLDRIDPQAEAVGAVNTVKIADGKMIGHNTDVYGFRESLLQLIGEKRPAALVLGTGGASAAVAYVLGMLGIPFRFVSRTPGEDRLSYGELTVRAIADHPLIVNCTPLGTYPEAAKCPTIPYEGLTPAHYLYDLVYNPPKTLFMEMGERKGAKVMNGYAMLTGQAEKAWQIWNEKE